MAPAQSVVSMPRTTMQLLSAQAPVANAPQRILLVGQITAAGSASDGEWVRDIGAEGQEDALFGPNSQLAAMVRVMRKLGGAVAIDAIALDDAGGGAARVVTMSVSGTATEAGTLYFNVGGAKDHTIAVGVLEGDTAAALAVTAAAAINADTRCRYTADGTGSQIELTADNAGTVALSDPIGVSGSVAGITIGNPTIDTLGATDPTLTSVLDAVGNQRYQTIVWPYWSTLDPVDDFLEARFNASNAILDGQAFVAYAAPYAAVGAVFAPRNGKNLTPIADSMTATASPAGYWGPSVPESTWVMAAYFAMIRALRLTPGEPISRFNTTTAPLDAIGGPHTASLPYFNTNLPDMPGVIPGLGWTATEIANLGSFGISMIGQNEAGSAIIANEMFTSYLTNAQGVEDLTWRFLNYKDTASVVREYMRNNVRARFGQTRLTQGETLPGLSMANEDTIRAYLVRLYATLAGSTFVCLQAGDEAVEYFRRSITITIDMATGGATVTCALPIVTQLREINIAANISFDIAA